MPQKLLVQYEIPVVVLLSGNKKKITVVITHSPLQSSDCFHSLHEAFSQMRHRIRVGHNPGDLSLNTPSVFVSTEFYFRPDSSAATAKTDAKSLEQNICIVYSCLHLSLTVTACFDLHI